MKARSEGLWNLFLPLESDPEGIRGAGLTNLEYSHLAEIMGRSLYASEVSSHMTCHMTPCFTHVVWPGRCSTAALLIRGIWKC